MSLYRYFFIYLNTSNMLDGCILFGCSYYINNTTKKLTLLLFIAFWFRFIVIGQSLTVKHKAHFQSDVNVVRHY